MEVSMKTALQAMAGFRRLAADRCVWTVWMTVFLIIGYAGVAPAQVDSTCIKEIENYRTGHAAPDSEARRKAVTTCVEPLDDKARSDRLDQLNPEALSLARMYFDIPEYHDEGRLPAGSDAGGALLGPLAGIYASPFLHGFTRAAQISEQGKPGVLAGIVVVQMNKWETTVPQTYRNLRLDVGVNCVWLFTTNGVKFEAFVSHPDAGKECDRTVGLQGGPALKPNDGILPVVAVRFVRLPGHAAYPAAARFDTNVNGDPILAFKCLNAFCEIGVSTHAEVRRTGGAVRPTPPEESWKLSPTLNAQVGQAPQRVRVAVVKGWQDQQALAIRDDKFVWRPSDVTATIIPHPALPTYDADTFNLRWKQVATIRIAGVVPTNSKYYKWGLRQGDNAVWFQFDGNAWKAEIRRPGGSATPWRYMKRTVHYDISVPPIVRFRWTGADDGVWAPCGNACCKAADQ
jgi:hypothetical protein